MSYGNGIKLTAGFDVGAKTPLDSKSVVQTIAERDAFVTDNLVYEGLEVYVKDTGHKYRYNGTSWIDLDTQSGSESGTGEGLTTEQAQQLTTAYEHSQTPHVSADAIPTNISDLTNDSGFITSIPEEYITETELNAKGYLTSHQDISGLQPKTDNNLTTTSKEVVGAINEVKSSVDGITVPTKVSDLENDSNFVTNSKMLEAIANAQLGNGEDSDIDLSAYQPIEESTLTTTAKTIPTAINELKSGLDDKVNKTDITTTIDSSSTDTQIPSAKATYDLANTKANTNHTHSTSDITDLSIPTKVGDLENDRGYLTSIPEEYITETELEAKGYLTSHQDISNLQSKIDNNLATTSKEVVGAINEVKSSVDGITVPTKTSDLTNDSGFITSIPSEYITETELETKGYLTEHQSLTDYAKKTDIPDVSDFLTEVPSEYVTDTKLSTELDKKVNKEVGKGLSTNDLTNELVTKINSSATEAFVTNAIANAQLDSGEVDLSGYATVDALELKADLTHTHDQYLTKVPDEYITETELNAKGYLTEHQDISNLALKSEIPDVSSFITSDDLPTVPTKVSDLANDSNFITSIPEEYITETELNAKGYLTSHQDISGLQPKTDNSLTTTDKTVIGAINEISGTQLDTVSFSADYKNIILNRKSGLNPYTIPIASIINNTSLTELKDIDGTDIGNGKTIVYNSVTQKHKYVNATLTDELVKMDSTTDAHYLADLIDKSTIVNEDGILKVKMLDGQDVTIAEINHLKGLTMNVMDLVNSFANGGVKVLNAPVATYADLITLDRSAFIEGISYIVYVLADETHTGAKTTYLCDKTSSTYFGNADSQRNFTTNPIDLANEITGKLGTSNIDVDSLWSLLTIDDTYKTLTTTDNVFGTHGAKAMYDELITNIGNKANKNDFDTHTGDTDIHITSSERIKWNDTADKVDGAELVKKADIKTTALDENATNDEIYGGKAIYDAIKNGAIENTVLGKETVLYGSQINATGTFTLTDDVNNYDFIIINHNMGGVDSKQSVVLTKNEISTCTDTTHRFLCTYGDGNASFCVFGYFNRDKVIITDCTTEVITSIVGYKFGQVTVENTITNPSIGKSYSTEEQLTGGTWIDGKPIYRKTINCGALPNSDGKDTPHGIANIDKVIDTYGIAFDSGGINISLPFADASSDGSISAYRNGAIIRITTAKDRTSFTESYVTLEYTKTTD